eukprot:TRINITY_DN1682_c0_g1_i1.p3 TRINITY_DN1682_c0_g1~~TRINITY_DN1682_c0_g1_i1.p3  ORF type:complete len:471 (-),score=83.81 TRINITY_DN1682_c0_g1_i1:1754-3166(-)
MANGGSEFIAIEAGVLQMELERGDLLLERQRLLQRNSELHRKLLELQQKFTEAEQYRRQTVILEEALVSANAEKKMHESEVDELREALQAEQIAALGKINRQSAISSQHTQRLLSSLQEENMRLREQVENRIRTEYAVTSASHHTVPISADVPVRRPSLPAFHSPGYLGYSAPANPPLFPVVHGFSPYRPPTISHAEQLPWSYTYHAGGTSDSTVTTLLQSHQRERDAWRRDVHNLEATLARLQSNLSAMVPLDVYRQREFELQKQCAAVSGRAQRAELEADRVAADLGAATADLRTLQEEVQRWRSRYEQSERQLISQQKELQVIRSDATQSVEEIQQQAERNRHELLRLKEQVFALQQEKSSKQSEIASLHQTYRSQLSDTERRCLDIARKKEDEVEDLQSELAALRTQLRRSEDYNRGLHVAVEDLKTKCVSLGATITTLDPAQRSRSSSQRSVASRSGASSPLSLP